MQTTGEEPGSPAGRAAIDAGERLREPPGAQSGISPAGAKRRLAESGIGAILALGYWGIVLAMFVVALIFIAIVMGPGIILAWLILCFAAWGLGLLLMLVAGVLAFALPRLRRAALGFIAVSAAANAVLAIGFAVVFVLAAVAD